MKVAILGQNGGWHTESLRGALAQRGLPAECYPVTQLTARVVGRPRLTAATTPLDDCDVVFVRAIPSGSLEQVVYRMDALRMLEHDGVRVVNSATAIEHGVDKYYTSARLHDAGVPTPRTVVCERFEEAMAAYQELGGDVVVKPLFGSEGRGIVRVSDIDTAYRVFRALELGRYIYCLQEFVPTATRTSAPLWSGNGSSAPCCVAVRGGRRMPLKGPRANHSSRMSIFVTSVYVRRAWWVPNTPGWTSSPAMTAGTQ